ncbi:MAG TPA: oligosaccharide flippase family protein, partial [Pyrinomonadaceae bacterium]|nr:oligosaccharide flippase family protein [Pyrinomonadaceae bacterium]
PVGVGYISALQSILGLSGMIAGLGIGTAIVRVSAKAISEGDERELAANRRAGFYLIILFGAIVAAVLTILRREISVLIFGDASESFYIGIISLAMLGSLLINFFIGILNAHHRVSTLAQIGVLNTLINACSLIGFVYFFRIRGIAFGILCGMALNSALNYFWLKREIPFPAIDVSFDEIKKAAFSFVRFGVPYTASMIVGTGVQLALPLLILNHLGAEGAGFYRAAFGISTMSLSLVLNAMGQDYYPRLSAIADDKLKINELVNQQQRLILILLAPIILWLLLLAPVLIRLLYSGEFEAAQPVFKWIVAGDLFKSMGWVLSFVILARNKSHLYFFSEAIGGATAIAAVLFGMQRYGLEGAGIGYFVSYLAYFIGVFLLVRREITLQYSAGNKLLMLLVSVAVLGTNILSFWGISDVSKAFLLIAAVAAAIFSVVSLINDIGVETLLSRAKFWQK